MKNVPLGEITAERYLEAKDEMGEEREIIVRIGKPTPALFPDPRESDTWCCPFDTLRSKGTEILLTGVQA